MMAGAATAQNPYRNNTHQITAGDYIAMRHPRKGPPAICAPWIQCDNFRSGSQKNDYVGGTMALIVVLVLIGLVVLVLAGMYNSLVQLRVRADSAWSDIDVQLKRRHDLIPNLVETVKGYAAHEKGTFENIAKFRSQAMQASTPGDKAVAENQLSGALKSLFAVAENYPELKASEQFTGLQSSLNSIEDNIQNARRYYNAVIRDYNTRVQSFPSNIIAGMFGFSSKQFFEVEAPGDRENVQVKF
jgi:LemA protein